MVNTRNGQLCKQAGGVGTKRQRAPRSCRGTWEQCTILRGSLPVMRDRCRICDLTRHSRIAAGGHSGEHLTSLFEKVSIWRRLSLLPGNFSPEAGLWLFRWPPCRKSDVGLFAPWQAPGLQQTVLSLLRSGCWGVTNMLSAGLRRRSAAAVLAAGTARP